MRKITVSVASVEKEKRSIGHSEHCNDPKCRGKCRTHSVVWKEHLDKLLSRNVVEVKTKRTELLFNVGEEELTKSQLKELISIRQFVGIEAIKGTLLIGIKK